MPTVIGPIYCETGHPWLFMAEPVNSVTNLAILLGGVLGLRALLRSPKPWPVDVIAMVALLFGCAIGSWLWHTFRTRLFLTLDVVPGMLFLLVLVFAWARRVSSALAGVGALAALVAAMVGTMKIVRAQAQAAGDLARTPFVFIPVYGLIIAAGLVLVMMTGRIFGGAAARRGALILAIAASAATFRTVDLMSCAVVPWGTHFLWHILLSLAAVLGIQMILDLTQARRRQGR